MSSIWDTLVTGYEAVVDFSNSGTMIADAVNGAMFGAISSAVGGGDIGEGAAWGAAGNMISGAGDEGIFNTIGRGVAGYGIDKSMGGDGLMGGAAGLLAGYQEGELSRTSNNQTAPAGKAPPVGTPPPPAKDQGMLESLGLQTASGEGTLLGKGVVSAIGAYGASEEKKEQQERYAELRDKSERNRKMLDEEFQQRNLAGFKQPNMIVRNG